MATETASGAALSVSRVTRVSGALSLLAVGAIHAILASRIAEGATVMLLGTFLAAESTSRARSRRYSG